MGTVTLDIYASKSLVPLVRPTGREWVFVFAKNCQLNSDYRAGEMAQLLKALAVLAGDSSLVARPSVHLAHNCL